MTKSNYGTSTDGRPRVAVLGGGVGGLTAAHELVERGFDVTVYEKKDRFGGKARSFPGLERDGGDPFPAEHGFRLFPGYYQHVTEMMSRIPYEGGSVKDNLVETTEFMQATNERQWIMQTATPNTIQDFKSSLWALSGGPDIPLDEKAYFISRLLHLLSSCDERLRNEFETVSWWDFIDARRMSEAYQKILGYGITRSLVAVRPEVASTRTIGRIYLQMLWGLYDESMGADCVLNGPTSQVWFDPWTDYLEETGVDLRTGAIVQALESDGDRVTEVRVDEGDGGYPIDADYYVAALPIETMRELLTPDLERAAPSISGIRNLDTEWMNGIMFYLKRDIPMVHGHGIYFDSPWALTTVSQRQFWEEYDIGARHDDIDGILSVVISDWNRPGIVYDKPARECSPHQIKEEVLEQLTRHLNSDDEILFSEDLIEDWFLDPAITYNSERGEAENSESLLINTIGSLKHRPEADTAAENLTLATDYVRTDFDLATMEAANEAGRRAVNAILRQSKSNAAPCTIWNVSNPPVLSQLRQLDSILYQGHVSHPGTATPVAWKAYKSVKSLM